MQSLPSTQSVTDTLPTESTSPPVLSGMPLFHMGSVVATPGALRLLAQHAVNPADLLTRHVQGDWGRLSDADRQANVDALRCGDRLLSVYPVPPVSSGETGETGEIGVTVSRVWVITEADRSVTTILLPEDY